MRIVIAGGHGQIALLLERLLAASGHEVVALIRNQDHAADVEAAGAVPLLLDLESADVEAVAEALDGADAAVFAAGAGPGSTAERKFTVDRDGAILLADAAERAGVRRLVVVSAMSADRFDPHSDDIFQVYLRAKSEADASVRSRDLDWTIVRPGRLSDEAATGRVRAGVSLESGAIPRADVSAVLAAVLVGGLAIRTQFDVVGGDDEIGRALRGLVGGAG